MPRLTGLEPSETSFLMRLVFSRIRKVLGKEVDSDALYCPVPAPSIMRR